MPDPVNLDGLDMGAVKEGVVEVDPMTGRMVIRSQTAQGTFDYFDVQEGLTRYKGQEVRIVIAPFATINALASMVENGTLPIDRVPQAGGR
jgi:hypothetical protein